MWSLISGQKLYRIGRNFNIAITVLGHSQLCPVAVHRRMPDTVPGSINDPLFQIITAGRRAPLTDSTARKHLKKISIALNIRPTSLFTILGWLLPLGESNMGCPWRI